jgi:2-polyprenyl-3-methyl-5-hydroxy-6-metoxy-1,4-benzoquinol methylase
MSGNATDKTADTAPLTALNGHPASPMALQLRASKPVAYDSPDHQFPLGTRQDNSTNPRFNQKLYFLYAKRLAKEVNLRILDLGCSGGGFVRRCINDGHLAVGLEGSDYSRRFSRAEWATIPQFLLTCDVTSEFRLLLNEEPMKFDVITSWELMEHIEEGLLPAVSDNCARHIKPGSLWIMSVSPNEEVKFGRRLHQTVRPKQWWIDRLQSLGWTHHDDYVKYFRGQFIRGPKYGAPNSFHLALSRGSEDLPDIPKNRTTVKLYDTWLNCKCHRLLKLLLLGPQ